MGGSESRFICKPLTTEKYLMVTAPHDNHQQVVLGPRDLRDRYQKVIFKSDDNCLNVRFDNHPQPYVCVVQSGDKWSLKMECSYDNDQAGHFQWKLVVLGKRKTIGGEWKEKKSYKLDWKNMKRHSLKAVFINSAANMVLSHDCISNELSLVKVSKRNVHTLSDRAVWEVECVDRNFNAAEAPAGVFVPFGAVAAIGEAAVTVLPAAQLMQLFEYLRLHPMADENGEISEYTILPSSEVETLHRPSSGCGTPAPLIFWLTCGFCPVAIFHKLIVYLSSPHVDSELKWELCSGDRFHNKVTFRVGRDQDELTLIARPMLYEVWIDRVGDDGNEIPLSQVCKYVRSTINKGITTVKSSFDSIITIDHRIGFYCQRPACAGNHPAVFKDIDGDTKPVCLSVDKASPPSREQRMWLGKLPQRGGDPVLSGGRPRLCDLEYLEDSSGTHYVKIIEQVQAKWRALIGHFHLPSFTEGAINATYPLSPQDACRDVFRQWLEGSDELLTPKDWNTVIEVMRRIGDSRLADHIHQVLAGQ